MINSPVAPRRGAGTAASLRARAGRWLMDEEVGREEHPEVPAPQAPATPPGHHWWQVMCLSGLDYFSTLGYQPAIAVLAAGALAPIATIILVIVTLCAALPVYRRVAEESPHGQGSIAMLERLLPHWKGKVLVLVLLGFAATDFMITITLSAADATAHVIENPLAPHWFEGQNVAITLVLLALLTALFLRGFHEVMGLAVFLVFTYLALNLVVIASSLARIAAQPYIPGDWWAGLTASHGSPLAMVAVALLVFPKLALGLSGFETGVAVMPQIRHRPGDTEARPAGRIRGAKRLLTTAALTMSAFLIASSVAVTWLVPEDELQPGGEANGRALAYLAHEQLGEVFGTVYDASTIGILWFAGASAMAGMLNLIPRYLPRFGMAPEWARANRPLALVLASIAVVVTVLFEASVDAQGAAYATGVLVLITSAAVAVTLSARRKRQWGLAVGFALTSVVFLYTTVANSFERPDGLRIAGFFILAIVLVSFASRFHRSTELRATTVRLDPAAVALLRGAEEDGLVRLIAHEPLRLSAERYRHKLEHARLASHLPQQSPTLFIEIRVGDFSDFAQDVVVRGIERHGYGVLEATAPAVPTAIAAICLHIRDELGIMPHVYFRWTEGSPLRNLLQFLFLGQGEIAPVTREVLREAEPNLQRRPWVHVG
ncbi:APC family permease [Arthrobacter ginkgonis]|uniref:APC family permease n=2 Tax=Arthrobacter ginkgonis TaxID=1630594 RepID=A0ABP7DJ50_9MICC